MEKGECEKEGYRLSGSSVIGSWRKWTVNGGWWQRKSESLRWVGCIVLAAAALPLYPAGWVERRKKNCVMMEESGSHRGAGNHWDRAGRWPSWMLGSNFSRGVLLRVMRTLLPDKLITTFGKAQTEPGWLCVVTRCGGWITFSPHIGFSCVSELVLLSNVDFRNVLFYIVCHILQKSPLNMACF